MPCQPCKLQLQNPALFTNKRTGAPSGSEERAELKAWLKATSRTALHDVVSRNLACRQHNTPCWTMHSHRFHHSQSADFFANGFCSNEVAHLQAPLQNSCKSWGSKHSSSRCLCPLYKPLHLIKFAAPIYHKGQHIWGRNVPKCTHWNKLPFQTDDLKVQIILLIKALWPRTTFGSQGQ